MCVMKIDVVRFLGVNLNVWSSVSDENGQLLSIIDQ